MIFKTSGEINYKAGDVMLYFNSNLPRINQYGIVLKQPTKETLSEAPRKIVLNVITIYPLSQWSLIRSVQMFCLRIKIKFSNNI